MIPKNLTPSFLFMLAAWIAVTIAACAVTPQGAQQSIAAGYATAAAVRATAADLLIAKTITADDARMVQGLADEARAALDLAQTYTRAGDHAGAGRALELATAVLSRVQGYLKNRGAP